MTFLAVITAFAIVQYWGTASGFHHDQWWRSLSARMATFSNNAELQILLIVIAPVVLLWLALAMLSGVSAGLYFIASIVLLLYSFGRGELTKNVEAYTQAYHADNSVAATIAAQELGAQVAEDCAEWGPLHAEVLKAAAYSGFERMFAGIFWFVVAGPAGAVFYRLTAMAKQEETHSEALRGLAGRLLWLLEWPAVRLMGLSFALTGNFVGCFQRWRDYLFCLTRPTEAVLVSFVHGALSVRDAELNEENITEQEIEALSPLLSRTLMLLLCALAVWSVI